MSKFKVGDKVKIPKTKTSIRSSTDSFMDELIGSGYKLDYLIVREFDSDGIVILDYADGGGAGYLFCATFNESDLELYEEKSDDANEPINIDINLPIEMLDMVEPINAKSNNKEGIKDYGVKWADTDRLFKNTFKPESKCDIWKRLIFAYADENNYNAVKEIAALADRLK